MDDTELITEPKAGIAEPGWYPDPDDPSSLRHWNGGEWSESLFDDITSVAVLESRDPELFLDEVDQPARVALTDSPTSASVAGPDERSPWTSAGPPRRNTAAMVVIGAAGLIAIVALGAVLWQLVGSGGNDDGTTESVAADETVEAPPAEPLPPPQPASDPVQASPSSAGESAVEPPPAEPDPTLEPAPAPAPTAGPLLEWTEVSLLVDSARVRSEPSLDSLDLATLTQSDTPTVLAVGEPVEGWRAIEATGGWVWGAFLAPAAEGYLVARTLEDTAAVLRDETGSPTGAPSFGGSYILVVDGSEQLWRIILPEGGFAYVDGAEFELVLS